MSLYITTNVTDRRVTVVSADGFTHHIDLPVGASVYGSPSRDPCRGIHIMDAQGVGVFRPPPFRPFLMLPSSMQYCTQSEWDHYCYVNPDPRYPVDSNALVGNT